MREVVNLSGTRIAVCALFIATVFPGSLWAQIEGSCSAARADGCRPQVPTPTPAPVVRPSIPSAPVRVPTVTAPAVRNSSLQTINQGLGGLMGIMNMMNQGNPQAPQEYVAPQVDPQDASRKAQEDADRRARIPNPFGNPAQGTPNPFAAAATQALSSSNPLALTQPQREALANGVKGCEALEQVAEENRALASGPGGEYQKQAAIAATEGARRCWQAVGGSIGANPQPGAVTVATLGNLSDQLANLLQMEVFSRSGTWGNPADKEFIDALSNLANRVRYAYALSRRGGAEGLRAAGGALPGLQDEFDEILKAEKQRKIDARGREESLARQVTEACGPGSYGSRCAAMIDLANSAQIGKCIDNWCYCPKPGGAWFATWCYGTSDPNRATKYIDAWGDGLIKNGEKGTNAIVRRDNPFPGAPASN